jgi:protein subunit release factor A
MDDIKIPEIAAIGEEGADRATEYFELKRVKKTLSDDLKDLTQNHENFEEAEKMKKELKILRDKINDNEDIRLIKEKVATIKERMELIKEIIKNELMETEEKEVKREGRKLKLVEVLKEMKDEEE